MQLDYDILILGGGLAGLTAAIDLGPDFQVGFIDPDTYPRHKMCGEYLSQEVTPYLQSLGIDISATAAVQINQFGCTTQSNKHITSVLQQGGYGLSRYKMDNAFYQKAIQHADFIQGKAIQISQQPSHYGVQLQNGRVLTASLVLQAHGKRSNMDKVQERAFIAAKSPWLAVKMHYTHYEMPDNLVELHLFEGGYAGLSRVEDNKVNLCYLVGYKAFQKHKNVSAFQKQVMSRNKKLAAFFALAQPVWDKPITIGQINFQQKSLSHNGMLMLGDAAALIYPMCGNGMAMAIQSAGMAGEVVRRFFKETETGIERERALNAMCDRYARDWKKQFSGRLRQGRLLQKLLLNKQLGKAASTILGTFPGLMPQLIKRTHG